eukprot:7472571-Prorocentrum_lima.AAC.1
MFAEPKVTVLRDGQDGKDPLYAVSAIRKEPQLLTSHSHPSALALQYGQAITACADRGMRQKLHPSQATRSRM